MDEKSIRPIADYILIRPLTMAKKTEGGIFLPDAAKTIPEEGRVLARGEKVTQVKVGQKVMYRKWEGQDITIRNRRNEEEKLRIIKEEHLLAIL